MLTAEERRDCIRRIRQLPAQLEAVVSSLTEAQLTTAFLPGEWTVAQNVHHLADSHMNAYVRTRLLLTEDRPTLKPYDQNVWAELPDARAATVGSSLALLHGLHQRWTALFESLGEADWPRIGVHPEYGEITVEGLLESYARHGAGHIEQIQKTLAAQ